MKKLFTAFAIVGLALCGGQAVAEIGTIDDVPAATLLLPYFEVDLDSNGNGDPCDPGDTDPSIDTLFSINNASAAPALAHVTLWTDWTATTIDFDVYLTGYDVQTISLYNVICNGHLPQTASSDDPDEATDRWSPSPEFDGPPAPPDGSENPDQADFWDDPSVTGTPLGGLLTSTGAPETPTCVQKFPFAANLLNGTSLQDLLISAHTGQAVPSQFQVDDTVASECWANDYGDLHARGYVTVDSTNYCSLRFPNNDGYFASGGSAVANNNNFLWGDYFIVEESEDFAQGETLVHIEADDQFENQAPVQTFWGRWDNVNATGIDGREPLGTTYATRYLAVAAPFTGTDLLVWRDAKFDEEIEGTASCGSTPPWFPLNEQSVVAFDEEERFVVLCEPENGEGFISPPPEEAEDPTCFPSETQRIPVQGPTGLDAADPLFVPWDFGWIFLNLNHQLASGITPLVPYQSGIAAAWVSAVMRADDRFSVGLDAIQLDNVTDYHPTYDSGETPFIADPDLGPPTPVQQ